VNNGLLVDDEAIADACLGPQIAGTSGIRFEFSAELAHVNTEILGLFEGLGTPDFVQEEPLGNDFTAVFGQDAEEFELGGGEVELLSGAADDARGPIDFDGAEAKEGSGGFLRVGAAQGSANASVEFGSAEGFGDEVISAAIEGLDAVAFLPTGGDDENGGTGKDAEARDQVETIAVGKTEV
jgi:hypothetical protein